MNASSPHSGSLINADYWWYVARAGLLDATFGDSIPDGGVVVDIGSADGPSVGWLDRYARRVPLDAEPSGGGVGGSRLHNGAGDLRVCSDLSLPCR